MIINNITQYGSLYQVTVAQGHQMQQPPVVHPVC